LTAQLLEAYSTMISDLPDFNLITVFACSTWVLLRDFTSSFNLLASESNFCRFVTCCLTLYTRSIEMGVSANDEINRPILSHVWHWFKLRPFPSVRYILERSILSNGEKASRSNDNSGCYTNLSWYLTWTTREMPKTISAWMSME